MRCRIDTGPRHPDEDAEYFSPEDLMPRYVDTAMEELEKRDINVWDFLTDQYGYDSSRHPMLDEYTALEFYLDDPEEFYEKLHAYG